MKKITDKNSAVAAFLKNGGKITLCAPRNAYGAQKKQKIKVPARFTGLIK
jgi:hypothetical protein